MENYGRPATKDDLSALPEYFAPGVDHNIYLGLSTRLLDFLCAFDQIVDRIRSVVDERADGTPTATIIRTQERCSRLARPHGF
mgnify:CR=1 FL=1